MKTLAVIGLFATFAAGLAVVPGGAIAQQRTLEEQLVGVWSLVSCEGTTANGVKEPYCTNPNGILILDASGRYARINAARGRPKFSSGIRSENPAEQFKAAAMGFVANFGTWSVNEAEKTITHHIEGASSPNIEGTDFKSTVNLSGDELKVVGVVPIAGGRQDSVYRRVK